MAKRTENKKIKNASPLDYNGIHFKSKSEVSAYKALLQAGFNPEYEGKKFVLWEGFRPTIPFYDTIIKKNIDTGKIVKSYDAVMSKLINITYTPDFIFDINNGNTTIIIEIKGFENDVFPIKKKLFRGLLENLKNTTLHDFVFFEIRNTKQLQEAINIIKKYETSTKNSDSSSENGETN